MYTLFSFMVKFFWFFFFFLIKVKYYSVVVVCVILGTAVIEDTKAVPLETD
jgi:hypothetical protein